MRTYDLTPFYRSTVGFDRFFSLLDQATADGSPGYPPYNIERTGENAYRISVAVSGFSQGELSIVAKENTLTIKGEKSANENGKDKSEVLYRGIAARAFERAFQLADFVQVKNASLENGLLHVDLVREIPEAKKPRSIPIHHRRPGSAGGRRLGRESRRLTRFVPPILLRCENAPGNRGVFLLREPLPLTPDPAPSAFPGSAGSAARAWPRRSRGPRLAAAAGVRRLRLHRHRLRRGLGAACGAPAVHRQRGGIALGLAAPCGSRMRHGMPAGRGGHCAPGSLAAAVHAARR